MPALSGLGDPPERLKPEQMKLERPNATVADRTFLTSHRCDMITES